MRFLSAIQRRVRSPSAAFIRRRGLLFGSLLLAGLALTVVIGHRIDAVWTATSYAEVNSGAGSGGPGSALDAAQLAASYAYVIPDDGVVLRAVASATGESVSDVQSGVYVYASSTSAELVLSFSSSSAAVAVRGAVSLARAVAAGTVSSAALSPGAVSVVSLPTAATPTSRHRTLAVGLLASLLLALGVTLAVERASPRVDDEVDLEEVLGVPVAALSDAAGASGAALLELWGRTGRTSGRSIIVTASDPRDDQIVRLTVHELCRGQEEPLASALSSPRTGKVPLALDCAAVLVVRRGSRAKDALRAASRLDLVGCSVIWALLGGDPTTGQTPPPVGHQDEELGTELELQGLIETGAPGDPMSMRDHRGRLRGPARRAIDAPEGGLT